MQLLRFQKTYFWFSFILLVVEIIIAVFVKDKFVRPYGGDFLVVILLYCLLRCLVRVSINKAAVTVLLFAYAVEAGQYFRLVEVLQLEKYQIATIVVGSAFEWSDLLAYTLGMLSVLIAEHLVQTRIVESKERAQRTS